VTRVVFLLAPRLHLLDLAGAAQVFFTADGYELHYVAEQADVVRDVLYVTDDKVAGPHRVRLHRPAPASRAGRRLRGQRAHADPAVL
jgi:hypothetical protein